MKFGSVCSGIEAASVAFEPLGWKAAWFSEIEPFPCAVLKHHYPDTPNHGDMTTLPERIRKGEVEAPDLFCGGTPCQAFSVAGLRQSLSDDRGNLSLTFCEIANAIDDVRLARGESPAVIFWENVPGVLSTQDNAFGCFLGALSGCDTPILPGRLGWTDAGVVAGPQRTVSWRVLDAQYFGLAQRRRRVFVVASARERFNPAEVLLEWEGLRRDFAPSREAGKGFAASTIAGSTASSEGVERKGESRGQDPVVAMCLNAHPSGRFDAESETLLPTAFGFDGDVMKDGLMETMTTREGAISDTAHAVLQPVAIQGNLIGREAGGPQGVGASQDGVMYTLTKMDVHGVAHTLRGEGFDASKDGTGRGTPLVPVSIEIGPSGAREVDVNPTLDTRAKDGPIRNQLAGAVLQPVAFHPTQDLISSTEVCHAIGANENATAAVMEPIPIDTMNHIGRGDSHSFGDFQPGAPSYTLTKGHSHAVAVAQQPIAWDEELNASVNQAGTLLRGGQGGRHDGVLAPTLTASNDPSRSPQSSEITAQVAAVVQATAWSIMPQNSGRDYKTRSVEVLQPLMAAGSQHGNQGGDIIQSAMQVRRLTPMECERLQGFPDGYTAIPWRGKPTEECPDGPRYKALGNSWAVPCVQWIGRRIQQEMQGKLPS